MRGGAALLRMRHFERHPHVLQHVMLGLVAAAVAIDDRCGGAFLEGTAECVHAGDGQRHGLNNARAATFERVGFRVWRGVCQVHPSQLNYQRNSAAGSGTGMPGLPVRNGQYALRHREQSPMRRLECADRAEVRSAPGPTETNRTVALPVTGNLLRFSSQCHCALAFRGRAGLPWL